MLLFGDHQGGWPPTARWSYRPAGGAGDTVLGDGFGGPVGAAARRLHHHGVLDTPAGADVLLAAPDGAVVAYVDRAGTAGTLFRSTRSTRSPTTATRATPTPGTSSMSSCPGSPTRCSPEEPDDPSHDGRGRARRRAARVRLLARRGAGAGAGPGTASRLTIAVPEDVGPLNILNQSDDPLTFLVYDRLVAPSPYAEDPQPWLATEVRNVDPRTWLISLRDDVTWHDGEPFTADDVAFTIDWSSGCPAAPTRTTSRRCPTSRRWRCSAPTR